MRPRSILRVLWLVLRSANLRCPHCQRASLFRRLYLAHRACPACGLVFERDEGDFWGTIVFTYTYAGIVGLAVAAYLFQLELESWVPIAFGASGATLATVLIALPFAKSQWIALLYATRGQYEEYRPSGEPPAA